MSNRSTQVQIASTAVLQDYEGLAGSFRRGLIAENKSPRTVKSYMAAVEQFGMFLAERRMPRAVASITREYVQEYITRLVETRKPATATNRFRSLHVFFAWLIEEGEITASPMEKMHAPSIPEEPPATLAVDHLRKLITACKGKEFADVRDTGIVLLFIDTGMRISELSGLTLSDVDLDEQVAAVIGKGGRPRVCPFGSKTARALDRYVRARTRHPQAQAANTSLWLGHVGVLSSDGVRQMIERRAEQAGLGHINPHQLRHTFAHAWLAAGGNEGDLMRLGGWRSRAVMGRYGASAADERAREAYKARSPVDRL